MNEHVCACVVTFDFTLKAISILLRDGFLVSFLVVLLGVLTAVVDPLDSILLNTFKKKKIKDGFYLNFL